MKKQINKDVYTSAIERLEFIFSEFDKVYLSFSAGKDSGVMLNLALNVMKRMGRKKLPVMYIDFEAQYKHTIDYCERTLAREYIEPFWVCLPMHLRNSVSQFQPHWLCWDEDKKEAWVRDMPTDCISDIDYFPFFRKGMEFEEFVPEFGNWFSKGKKTACIVGIRSDESLNRFRTIKSESKETYKGKQWSTRIKGIENEVYNFYPIYDWQTRDVWIANGKFGYDYNKIYDLMNLAGLSIHQMRLCQPYGDDQRKGLYLFKQLEPETWNKVVNRVEGANFGANYVIGKNGMILGNNKIKKPDNHTWESYAKFLLNTMPPNVSAHYWCKINTFIKWWKEKGGYSVIPDEADKKLEAQKKAPSWRRIVKVIIKNDYWCKGLSFAPTKKQMEKHLDLTAKYLTNESN